MFFGCSPCCGKGGCCSTGPGVGWQFAQQLAQSPPVAGMAVPAAFAPTVSGTWTASDWRFQDANAFTNAGQAYPRVDFVADYDPQTSCGGTVANIFTGFDELFFEHSPGTTNFSKDWLAVTVDVGNFVYATASVISNYTPNTQLGQSAPFATFDSLTFSGITSPYGAYDPITYQPSAGQGFSILHPNVFNTRVIAPIPVPVSGWFGPFSVNITLYSHVFSTARNAPSECTGVEYCWVETTGSLTLDWPAAFAPYPPEACPEFYDS